MGSVEDRSTVPPPPDGPLFTIQLYYPNNIPLAKQISLFLRSRLAAENKMFHFVEHEALSPGMRNVRANLVILGVDEFCHPDNLVTETRRHFSVSSSLIIHETAPDITVYTYPFPPFVIGTFSQFDFQTLLDLVAEAIAADEVT